MSDGAGTRKDSPDAFGYEPYTPSANPDGLIRELTIPEEMVVDLSRPKVISPKPEKKERALRALSVACIICLAGGGITLLQAMPQAADSFWSLLTDAWQQSGRTWNFSLLHVSLVFDIVCVLVCAAGLTVMLAFKKQKIPHLVLFSAAALLSVLSIVYSVSVM